MVLNLTDNERQQALLEATSTNDIWSIWYAAQHGKIPRLETLLKRNSVQIDGRNMDSHWTPLHYAAKYSQVESIRTLISHNANVHLVDHEGNSPLHLSAESGSIACCRLLLLEGIIPDFPNPVRIHF